MNGIFHPVCRRESFYLFSTFSPYKGYREVVEGAAVQLHTHVVMLLADDIDAN